MLQLIFFINNFLISLVVLFIFFQISKFIFFYKKYPIDITRIHLLKIINIVLPVGGQLPS